MNPTLSLTATGAETSFFSYTGKAMIHFNFGTSVDPDIPSFLEDHGETKGMGFIGPRFQINNCVGELNQKYFIQFLIFVGLASVYSIIMVVISWTGDCTDCKKEIVFRQHRV
ncbi:hypothetical protein AVEN_100070-1, partial [Araneus ventricosus]